MDEVHRILVIDDDVDMCEFLSDVLKGEGMDVSALSDSLEACKVLRREEFDVVITDLKMKGLKGLDVLT
jgi:two-component system response regulator AtoC